MLVSFNYHDEFVTQSPLAVGQILDAFKTAQPDMSKNACKEYDFNAHDYEKQQK